MAEIDHPKQKPAPGDFPSQALDAAIKIGLVGLLAYFCIDILRPFAIVLTWAAIMAIAIHPLCVRLAHRLGGRVKLSAILLTVLGVALLLGPVGGFSVMLIGDARGFMNELSGQTFELPQPDERIRTWPLIGEFLHEFWVLAATNLRDAVAKIGPQLEALGQTLLSGLLNTGLTFVQVLLAVLVGGYLLMRAEVMRSNTEALARRLVRDRATEFVSLTLSTIRNVARGVLGTAVIQSFFVGLGMLVAGIPGAGIWTALSLLLAVVQIGPGLVLIGTVIYMFWKASTLAAVLYLIWVIPVALMDNFLKPILLGKGSSVPTSVVFLGVIGGTLTYGIIGVFIGPVILAVGYTLFATWVGGEASLLRPRTSSTPTPG